MAKKYLIAVLILLAVTLAVPCSAQVFGLDPPVVQLPFLNVASSSTDLQNWWVVNHYSGAAITGQANGKVRTYFSILKSTGGTGGQVDIDEMCVISVDHANLTVNEVKNITFNAGSTPAATTFNGIPSTGTANVYAPTVFKSDLMTCAVQADCKYGNDILIAMHFKASDTNNSAIQFPAFDSAGTGAANNDAVGYSYGFLGGTDLCGLAANGSIPTPPSAVNHLRVVSQVSNN
jgi:hypothetical protein